MLLAAGPAFAPEGGLDRFVRLPYTQPAHVLSDAIERLGAGLARDARRPRLRSPDRPTLVA